MTEDEMAGWHHRLDGCEFETMVCGSTQTPRIWQALNSPNNKSPLLVLLDERQALLKKSTFTCYWTYFSVVYHAQDSSADSEPDGLHSKLNSTTS